MATKGGLQNVPLELFFPSSGVESFRNMNVIKPFCDSCPVQPECLEYALREPDQKGIWAGTTENDRRKIRYGPTPIK